jgi:hypothetical protein
LTENSDEVSQLMVLFLAKEPVERPRYFLSGQFCGNLHDEDDLELRLVFWG